jgi:hypothetical protein
MRRRRLGEPARPGAEEAIDKRGGTWIRETQRATELVRSGSGT